MGKIILEFDSVEESTEIRNALDGTSWKYSMWSLDKKLRSVSKHGYSMFGNFEASDEELKIVAEIRDEIRRILEANKLDLED